MSDEFINSLPSNFFKTGFNPGLNDELKEYTTLQLLCIQKRQVNERIAEVLAKPRPNYDIDGQKISWADYLESLYKARAAIEQAIAAEEGPTEEETVAWN